MRKPIPLFATVVSTQPLSTSMQRIALQSDAFKGFPEVKPGAYIKLMFTAEGFAVNGEPGRDTPAMMRTYTIRHLDTETGTMIIDFALHGSDGQSGPASTWASNAVAGDKIGLAGPGSTKPLAEQHDWVLLAGDMTALPAIESHLAILPAHTPGYAVLKVDGPQDIRAIDKPQNMQILWLTEPGQQLAEHIRKLPPLSGKPAIWAASEFSQMREMRTLFNDEWRLPRSQVYISSYWKKGRSEDQHKVDKRKDLEALA